VSRRTAPSVPPAGRLLTIAEAGEYVRLSRTTLYGLMNDGLLAYVKIGKARRIPLAALVKLVESKTRTEPGGPR
jgi:excisionase family DNA binding protein